MFCKKCGAEVPDGSLYCNKCGAKMDAEEFTNASKRKSFFNKKTFTIGVTAIAVVLVACLIFIFTNNGLVKFKNAVRSNNYSEAAKAYEQIKKDEKKNQQAIDLVKKQINDTFNEYKENKIDYNEAVKRLKAIGDIGINGVNVNDVLDEVNKLNNSRIAFKKGKELISSNNYAEGIAALKNVLESDENYSEAQKLIQSSIKDYKNVVLAESENLAKNEKYEDALKIIDKALTIIPNDGDLTAKRSAYDELNKKKAAEELKKKIELLKANQEVVVVSTRIISDWLHDEIAEIVVKNNSNKVIKKYVVGWMAFDKNGYPVKSGWLLPDYVKEGEAEVNIQPGETEGKNAGFDLGDSGAAKIIACVKEVSYYDGSSWVNEYYDYWVDEYKGKPLKQ